MERNKTLTEWLIENNKYGIFYPPMKAEMFIDYIKDYLLWEDWYTINPVNAEQVYTEILVEVLEKYSKRFKKEIKKMRR